MEVWERVRERKDGGEGRKGRLGGREQREEREGREDGRERVEGREKQGEMVIVCHALPAHDYHPMVSLWFILILLPVLPNKLLHSRKDQARTHQY